VSILSEMRSAALLLLFLSVIAGCARGRRPRVPAGDGMHVVLTDHIVVRGRILRREGGVDRPLRRGELLGKVGISLHPWAPTGVDGYTASLEVDAWGAFVVHVPRAKYRVLTINLGDEITPSEVDLSHIAGAGHRMDFVLLPH
jgi:hypothetical protein